MVQAPVTPFELSLGPSTPAILVLLLPERRGSVQGSLQPGMANLPTAQLTKPILESLARETPKTKNNHPEPGLRMADSSDWFPNFEPMPKVRLSMTWPRNKPLGAGLVLGHFVLGPLNLGLRCECQKKTARCRAARSTRLCVCVCVCVCVLGEPFSE